jgi:hypothetical protein
MHVWKIARRYLVGLVLTIVIAPVLVIWAMWPLGILADFVNLDARSSSFWGQANPPLTFAVGFILVVLYYSLTVFFLSRLVQMVRALDGMTLSFAEVFVRSRSRLDDRSFHRVTLPPAAPATGLSGVTSSQDALL